MSDRTSKKSVKSKQYRKYRYSRWIAATLTGPPTETYVPIAATRSNPPCRP